MKCPKCNGQRYKAPDVPCGRCDGKGVVEPLTNEEWFCDLSTEEKADKLTDFSFWLVPTLPSEDKREQIRKKLLEWLKEIHDEMSKV